MFYSRFKLYYESITAGVFIWVQIKDLIKSGEKDIDVPSGCKEGEEEVAILQY